MATTINSYNTMLTMDASSYIRNSDLSRRETSSLIREINSARTPAENYERKISELDKALKAGAISQGTYNRLVENAKKRFDEASKGAGSLASSMKRIAAAYVGFSAIKSGASTMIELAAEAEQAAVAFRVLVGDAEIANGVLQEIRDFAASTPFQFPDLQNAARMLIAFNFSASEVTDQLRILGNIAAGTNQPIGELAELVGKARVQTTIYTEDLNQFTGRGINVLDGLAKRFGVTTAEVKKLASESKITFTDLQAVLEDLATGTGKFNGLMEEQAQTLSGTWSTLKDNVSAIATAMGTELLPALKQVVSWTSQYVALIQQTNPGPVKGPSVGLLDPNDFLGATGGLPTGPAEPTGPTDTGRRGFGSGGYFSNHVDPSAFDGAADAIGGVIDDSFAGLRNTIDDWTGWFADNTASLGSLEDAARQLNKSFAEDAEKKNESNDELAKSFEVGTQEAYRFIAQQQQNEQAKEEQHRKKMEQESARSNQLLTALVDWAQENGFRRYR